MCLDHIEPARIRIVALADLDSFIVDSSMRRFLSRRIPGLKPLVT